MYLTLLRTIHRQKGSRMQWFAQHTLPTIGRLYTRGKSFIRTLVFWRSPEQASSRGPANNLLRLRTLRSHLLLVVCTVLLSSCMSMQSVDLSGEDLRKQVRAGKIVQPGQQVSITTEDGDSRELEVLEVTNSYVKGEDVDVPIDSINSLKTEQLDRTRTTLAVIGAIFTGLVIAVAQAQKEIIEVFGGG